MSVLKVNPSGLRSVAARCESWAVDLTGVEAPIAVGGQASAAAVNAINDTASRVGAALSSRLRCSADLLGVVITGVVAHDEGGADVLGAVRTR